MNHPEPTASTGSVSLMSNFLNVLTPVNGRKPSVTVMRQRTMDLLRQAKSRGTLDHTVRQMVLLTGLQNLLPASYAKFQTVVLEGMIFMMSGLPLTRLAEKIVDQLRLPHSAPLGERLLTLVKDMPTMQKLGQIICRSPGLDPAFKQALIDLEDNIKTVTYGRLQPVLAKEIRSLGPGCLVIPEKRILAEASVCTVVPAEVRLSKGRRTLEGVLKMVKPRVRRNMPGELALLDRLVRFLDRRKQDWGLGEFSFKGNLSQVRRLLENEVDLVSEQRNLDAARTYYGSDATLAIPEKLPVSSPTLTAMSRIDGTKITDVEHLTPRQRRRLAATLAKICILRPIQDMKSESIFHGDPHAGNLAYNFVGKRPKIIFYDWGMLGRLQRLERFTMALLTLGLIMGNAKAVYYAADLITKGQISSSQAMSAKIKAIIDEAITRLKEPDTGVLSIIEFLFEKFTYQGVIFSTDLLMYEKALVTLKGVLADIDPTFNRDDYMAWAAITTFLDDVIRLRLLKLVMKDIWALYRHSLYLLLDIQKFIFGFVRDVAVLGKKRPGVFSNNGSQKPYEIHVP
jgi:ubiquinone biosynthesis protein